jgi:OPA family glycerol-3-phosphate transporter-like MFS transporter
MAVIQHTAAFRTRRFLNWFPLGLSYALLYMGRYNLTVAKNALGALMTKEDFGFIFGVGTLVYACSFLINGPLVDRYGGRRGMLIALAGTLVANVLMGLFLAWQLNFGGTGLSVTTVFAVLYGANMYFQSFGAVSIVKVNAHWFHVSERGGFSGIFGTMISSGIFLAFTVNGWLLDLAAAITDRPTQWIVFLGPAALIAVLLAIEIPLLRDRPSLAGQKDFDTGDASSGDESAAPIPTVQIFIRLLTNPIVLTVAFIEFCTGVLRNGVMHWFPIYVKEDWALPLQHPLNLGSWEYWWLVLLCFAIAGVLWFLAKRATSTRRGTLVVLGALVFLAPFLQAGWGGLLFVAGVIGANVAGWVSDLLFQSRRGPSVTMLYGILTLCTIVMWFVLAPATPKVEAVVTPSEGPMPPSTERLEPGDEIVSIAGRDDIEGWSDVTAAVACWQPECADSVWNAEDCVCETGGEGTGPNEAAGPIPAVVIRDGEETTLSLVDPKPRQRAGDRRAIAANPVLPMSPYWLGAIVFLLSLAVIGSHGLLSGTATMDFGGRKAAATAVGLIDGFVYLGTALQSFALGYLTSEDWGYWPWFLVPFALIGTLLCIRIWSAHPNATRKGAKK